MITGGASVAVHPVGSKVAVNPATIAAAFKVFLRFAFIGLPFNCGCMATLLQLTPLTDAIARSSNAEGFIKFVSNKYKIA